MTSWSKSVTINTLWNEAPPPLFLDETEARRAEKFFLRLPPLVSGSGWTPLPPPLIWRYGFATAYIQFYLGAPPRESELTCSLSLDKFPRRNSYIQLTIYCSWANWAEAFCHSQSMCYTCAWVLVKNCLYRVPDCTGSDQGRTLWLPGVCWNAPFAGDHPNGNGQIEELNKT